MIKYKHRLKILGSLLLLMTITNLTFFLTYSRARLIEAPHDVDRKANGNTLICTTSFAQMLAHIGRYTEQEELDPNNKKHRIIEVNQEGNVVWEVIGLGTPHEVEEIPSGHLLVADTNYDRVIEIDYPNTNIIWSWEPKKINWTEVNPDWGADHYYNNPTVYDFTHVNDVDFRQYSTWDACLISLRNFDLVVEVNYTAEILGPENNPDNIVWWYGDFRNASMVSKQHNPDYLSNGNIIIADSLGDRIVEINRTTKQIVWQYDEGLRWPRDADELSEDRLLITDCFNNRIIEINKTSKEILWQYRKNVLIPYESDMLDNGNILISGEYAGVVLEVNREGKIVWQYGKSTVKGAFYINAVFLGLISLNGILYQLSKLYGGEITKKEKIRRIITICVWSVVFLFCFAIIVAYHSVLRGITQLAHSAIDHEVF